MNATADLLQLVWPLAFVLIFLFVLRRLGDDVKPIVSSVVGGLSRNAASNATQYAIAIGFGLSASLSAFVDVFKELGTADLGALSWHQYAALWAKVANPFIVAVLAFATQSKVAGTNGTNPPFAKPPTP